MWAVAAGPDQIGISVKETETSIDHKAICGVDKVKSIEELTKLALVSPLEEFAQIALLANFRIYIGNLLFVFHACDYTTPQAFYKIKFSEISALVKIAKITRERPRIAVHALVSLAPSAKDIVERRELSLLFDLAT